MATDGSRRPSAPSTGVRQGRRPGPGAVTASLRSTASARWRSPSCWPTTAAFPAVSGGFIGVDVFFVLSGFLITSLLLDELGRTGGIDLPGFWVRRARRLLPALIVMVLAVVVLRELFPSDAVAAVRDDAVAAFFWVANWVFVFRDTDYFTQGDTPSPLQHTWSLAVEEQYYVVWPLVLVAVAVLLALLTRHGTPGRSCAPSGWSCAGIAVAGAAASAVAACLMTSDGLAEPRLLRHRHPRAGAARRGGGGGAAGAGLVVAGAVRQPDPGALGPLDRADIAGLRADDARRCRALRDGQCAGVPPWTADRGGRRGGLHRRTGGARAARAGRARARPSAAGVAGHDLLRRLPLALAGLPRAQRRTHRPDGHVAVRDPGGRDGDVRCDVVVAGRAADQALAACACAAAAARRSHAGDRGRRDDGRRPCRHQAGRRGPARPRHARSRRATRGARRDRRHRTAGARHPHGRRIRRLDGVDHDALPAADAGIQVHRLHHHRLRHRARRAVPVDRARPSRRSPSARRGLPGGPSGSATPSPTSCC